MTMLEVKGGVPLFGLKISVSPVAPPRLSEDSVTELQVPLVAVMVRVVCAELPGVMVRLFGEARRE